ncbi:MAG: glycoside hydrolase family 3 C-terminal domain-containing protein, partial [Victivallales bacterium]|nr:glycoside hydrolase family 3 C-terminal domain-containing protein [Victivallales bacterium]
RWGRGQETYGEDPYLTSRLGAAFVEGLQGEGPRYLRAAACAKHFWGHSGPEAKRHGFDAQISAFDAETTYLPAFRHLVKAAKVAGVMGAYNRTNGKACCASDDYIQKLLKDDWGFDGYFTSDCGAICDLFIHHGLAKDMPHAAALALKAGCDLNCGEAYSKLEEALRMKLITEEDLDKALRRLFTIRMRLGEFDPPEKVPGALARPEVVGCPAHRRLALKAALKSAVLLKNEHALLPLNAEKMRAVCLAGPNVDGVAALWGNYHGLAAHFDTPLEAMTRALPPGTAITYAGPSDPDHPDLLCANPEVVFYFAGLNESLEGEEMASAMELGGDRSSLGLPASQRAELDALYARGAKVVLIVIAGSPIDLTRDSEKAKAILFIPYPGEAGGEAIARILFGKDSPAGRLPVSFPAQIQDLPPFEDYSLRARTYKYCTKRPRFPFGYGLSYTKFQYAKGTVAEDHGGLKLRFTLKNIGKFDGTEVVQIYLRRPDAGTGHPAANCELVAFRAIPLKRGAKRQLAFRIDREQLERVCADGTRRYPENEAIELFVGGDSSLENAPLRLKWKLR